MFIPQWMHHFDRVPVRCLEEVVHQDLGRRLLARHDTADPPCEKPCFPGRSISRHEDLFEPCGELGGVRRSEVGVGELRRVEAFVRNADLLEAIYRQTTPTAGSR